MDTKDFQGEYMDGLIDSMRREGKMDDGQFFELALDNLRSDHRDENLWAACLAHCEFNTKPAQAMYVRKMARALEERHALRAAERQRQEEQNYRQQQQQEREAEILREVEQEWGVEREQRRQEAKREAESQHQEQMDAWLEGRAEHPNRLSRVKWAIWGGVVMAVLLFSGPGPWVGFCIGAVCGWLLAHLLNSAVEGNHVERKR
ncbi:hypothetical protein VRRI112168_02735 [Vreelandella rituensis]|uniref:Uncharacterized protein n=1 Tax=Vreelandella rituensis TaxID=2282306 RepID=A0A368U983_9GAMM|nr:hypothetical protein [Halomonas rituensis]RCV93660.1 hypothetical protein DU506_00455 [Halomonas rituensis]